MNDMILPGEQLAAIEEIKKLKARYFRYVDTKDWEGLQAVFCADASFDYSAAHRVRNPWTGSWNPPLPETVRVAVGRGEIVALIRGAVERLHTTHHGHLPEISLLTATTAVGIWAMNDSLRDAEHHQLLEGSGHYHDTYTRLPAGWAIASCRLTRLSLRLANHNGELYYR
jgi:SnoaL-like domain